jgi:hypothetical protein
MLIFHNNLNFTVTFVAGYGIPRTALAAPLRTQRLFHAAGALLQHQHCVAVKCAACFSMFFSVSYKAPAEAAVAPRFSPNEVSTALLACGQLTGSFIFV